MPSPYRRRPLTGSTKGTSGTLPRTWLNERSDEEYLFLVGVVLLMDLAAR